MPPTINRSMTALEWGLLAALSVLWGGSFTLVAVAVAELPPFTLVTARLVLAALVLVVALRAGGQHIPAEPRLWLAFIGMGLLNNVIPYSLIAWGQTQIASGLASILNATTPLFTVVLAHLATHDEKMTGGRLAGVIVGFAGVAVMIGGQALASLDAGLLATLACLGGAFSYAAGGVYGRRFRAMGVAPMATAAGQLIASSAVLLPAALVIDQPWTLAVPSATALGALVALALLSTALAYVIYFRILATAGATNLLLVTFLIPVTAIVLGLGLLGESLALRHLAGMALIAAGLAAIDGRLPRALCRRSAGRPT